MIGIYEIVNLVNTKRYVGQSYNVKNRLKGHYKDLSLNRHKNKHLQSAVNKYGIENFQFLIIEECNEYNLDDREIHWISFHKSSNREHGYNIQIGGNSSNKLYASDINEIVEKFKNDPYLSKDEIAEHYNISASTIYGILRDFKISPPKKICSEDAKKKLSNINKGKILTSEHKRNISKASSLNQVESKYTKDQIDKVISMLLEGYDNIQISKATLVSYSVVNGVRKKSTWKELIKDFNFPIVKAKDTGRGNSRLTDEQVIYIINLMLKGLTNREIIEEAGIKELTMTIVRGIRNKKSFKYLTNNIDIPIVKQKNQYK